LKEEETLSKLRDSNASLEHMVDLLPGRSITQIKSKLTRLPTFPKKRESNNEKESKEAKKQKGNFFIPY
jgi:hypothetical protein